MMSPRVSALIFLLVSLGVHIGSMQAIAVPDTTLSAASPPAALVSYGNNFADMVMGSPETTPEVIDAVEAEQTESPALAQPTQSLQPETTETTDEAQTSDAPILDPIEVTSGTVDILAAVTPSTASAAPAAIPTTLSTIEPVEVTTSQPDRLEALPDVQVNDASLATVRPTQRPSDLGQTVASGNANQDARRGSTIGTQQVSQQSQQSGQGQQVDEIAIQAAREAAANYGNAVMRKISRTRQERIRARGTAIVQFRVAASGQIGSIGIAQSSGNASLDSAAVNHIRRSAPFPAPPAGAATSFTIPIEWR
ncbi:energy transducer TonB [Loktanella sp. D2R18]|uniref:energy transducer TonB n=1 Tax=Rhodobacterales TaxID=204455 RepID=UPI000DEBABB5|nr:MULTISPECIES: energy transducer TonB [Rhodobacterales]MDO6591229.1 TonB family protein [Yoonia sp. 1_MG-2023]RBW41490.1 energy transducer TonB [Loktanella sp. D2R18]